MDLDVCMSLLKRSAGHVTSLVQDVSDAQARWKPAADSWSILEVLHHLYDEEKEDFRVRLDYLLHHPQTVWPALDTEGWVITRDYNAQEPEKILQSFLDERQASLTWLRTLDAPDWDVSRALKTVPIRAGDMLASWVRHDQLHLRQLINLHLAYTATQVLPYHGDYAGG